MNKYGALFFRLLYDLAVSLLRVFALVRVTGIHLTIVQTELILMYPMWACVHKNHSSWLEQDNAETVGGVATQSTVPCVPLCQVVISFL